MERGRLDDWLEAYGHAWEGRDPEGAARLFADNATYQVTPFREPMVGRDAIRDYWAEATDDQRHIRFRHEVIGVTNKTGVAHWQTAYMDMDVQKIVVLDGIFLISLDEEGRATALREWWHRSEEAIA